MNYVPPTCMVAIKAARKSALAVGHLTDKDLERVFIAALPHLLEQRPMIVDLGDLTQEQILRMFRAAMAEMSLTDIIKALEDDLEPEDRLELLAKLSDKDAG